MHVATYILGLSVLSMSIFRKYISVQNTHGVLLYYLRRTARRWPLAAGGDKPAQQCCVVVGAQCPLYREASQPALHKCHHGMYFLLNHVMYMCLMREILVADLMIRVCRTLNRAAS